MLRLRTSWLLLPALLGACADSCSCGKKAPKPAAVSAAEKPAISLAPRLQPLGQAGTAAVSLQKREGQASWEPAPPSPLVTKLESVKKAIEKDTAYRALASGKDLSAPLKDKLGKLKAEVPAAVTERGDDDHIKLTVAVRDYTAAGKQVRVKITDTGLFPTARHTVANRLTLVGNDVTGREHGLLVRGTPAVLGHIEDDRLSRVTALVANRFLVEITVRGATEPDEAVRVLEQIDLAAVAKNSK